MRIRVISFLAVIFALLGVLGCNSAEKQTTKAASADSGAKTTPQTEHKDGVRRITTSDLQELMEKGEVFIVDVRTEAAYKNGHIKGAVLIPNKDVSTRIKEFPRDKTIVTYCS